MVALIALVLGWLLWQRYADPVTLLDVTVRPDKATLPCGGTAQITGTLTTDGGGGTLTYRWRRSDGTDSGQLTQQVPAGRHHTEVALRWTFQGQGTLHAEATLDVLSPMTRSVTTAFAYSCRR